MLAHQLHHQRFPAEVPQLIEVLQLKIDDSLHVRLVYGKDAGIGNVLAEQHAEIGGSQGAWLVPVRQVYQGKGCAGREHQAHLSLPSLDGEQQLVCLRLGNLADAPALGMMLNIFY